MKWFSDYKKIFILLSVIIGITLPVLSFDFGITEDEQAHNQHGKSILNFFLGENNDAIRSPIDSTGKLLNSAFDSQMNDISGEMNMYGGLFDLICAIANKYFLHFGEFENRHFVNSLFGLLLIIFSGLVAQFIGGWRAGVITLLLLAISPRIIAYSMNNPKDLPFAAFYMLNLFFIFRFVQELPRPSLKTWLPLLIGIPLAADIRISGLLLIIYLLLFVCARWGVLLFKKIISKKDIKDFFRSIGLTFLICAGGYFFISAFWPFAHTNPLTVPMLAIKLLSSFEIFNSLELFGGKWINRWEIPWYFIPKWLMIGYPLFILLGITTSLFFLRKSFSSISRKKNLLLVFTFLFPICFVIFNKSNIYDDARHVLFAYPPLVVCCALSFENILRMRVKNYFRIIFISILGLTLIEPIYFMVKNHPNENVYFSPLIGGVDGAFKKYETDFWGSSVRQAVEWIQKNVTPKQDDTIRIRNWYGDQMKAKYYIRKKTGYKHVLCMEDSREWDYEIVQTVECKYTPEMLESWPPPNTVYEVKADNTPLCAVVENFRNKNADDVLGKMNERINTQPTFYLYYSLAGMNYYFKKYAECIDACQKSIALKQNYANTWSLLASAYGMLGKWDEEIEACKKALAINPNMDFVRSNMNFALLQKNKSTSETIIIKQSNLPQGLTADEYINLSLKFYNEKKFEAMIDACRMAISKNPSSAIAYNNLCSAYNSLEKWNEAKDACEMALALQPDFNLAKNNLNVALQHLKK
ncbi:MAG: glycosyltransferase family 39 protein [Bacteroidetes bacterium]|nr:glycosyltransferase family 39 protein [Bacteroidota bacterium]